MGFLDHHKNAHDEVMGGGHKPHWSHELIAAAASYAAMHEYNKHKSQHGEPVNHEKAKEIVAGLAGGIVERLFETKGLNMLDKAKVKHQAEKEATSSLKGGV